MDQFDARAKEIVPKTKKMNGSVKGMQISSVQLLNNESQIFCNVWNPIDKKAVEQGSPFSVVIYSLGLITGWSLISTALPEHHVVIQESSVKYQKPIVGPYLLSKCCIQKQSEEFFNVAKMKNESIKGKVSVEIRMFSVKGDNEDFVGSDQESEAIMTAKFHVSANPVH